jgi:type II secretory ATPase GspE/PulE/Tfp pilus assembly ATPase PilB-like protein
LTTDYSLGGFRSRLANLDSTTDAYATRFVDVLLTAGRSLGASDLHLLPTDAGMEIRLRIDGVLEQLGTFPPGKTSDVISRLKVLAELLTYRTDVPQEGRIRDPAAEIEMRVSTFPTLHGEKAVVRLFAAVACYPYLADLGLPATVATQLNRLLDETSGAILIVGPAGSGKTTTAYACLRELVRRSAGGRSIATLEDPVEVALAGVAQSQVNARAGLDLATGLRSLLRQDPQVIMVGEMRDPVTAGIALQASLTGQLMLTTFHAGSAAGAISRLADMGVEPYVLRSGILAVVCQRLVRKLCSCAIESDAPEARLGLPVAQARLAGSCPQCHGTGYCGRTLLAEMLAMEMGEVPAGVLSRADMVKLERAALDGGMLSRWHWALQAVETGLTSAAEVRRVLGFTDALGPTAS